MVQAQIKHERVGHLGPEPLLCWRPLRTTWSVGPPLQDFPGLRRLGPLDNSKHCEVLQVWLKASGLMEKLQRIRTTMAVGRSGNLPPSSLASHEEGGQCWQERERDRCLYSTKTHLFAGVHPPGAYPTARRMGFTPKTAQSCSAAPKELGVSVTQQSIKRKTGNRASAKAWHKSCWHTEKRLGR